jgi:hypothetical protein
MTVLVSSTPCSCRKWPLKGPGVKPRRDLPSASGARPEAGPATDRGELPPEGRVPGEGATRRPPDRSGSRSRSHRARRARAPDLRGCASPGLSPGSWIKCLTRYTSSKERLGSGSGGLWQARGDAGQRCSLKNPTTSSVRVLT